MGFLLFHSDTRLLFPLLWSPSETYEEQLHFPHSFFSAACLETRHLTAPPCADPLFFQFSLLRNIPLFLSVARVRYGSAAPIRCMTALPFALLPHGILSSLSAVMAPYILPFLSAAMAPYIPPSLSAAMALYIPLSLSATMVPCIPHSPSAAMTQCIPASPSAVYHLLEGTFQQPPYNPFGPLLFHVLCSRHTRYLYPPQSLSHRRVSSLFHNLLP